MPHANLVSTECAHARVCCVQMRPPQRNRAQHEENGKALLACYQDPTKLQSVEKDYKGVFKKKVVEWLNKLPVGLEDTHDSRALTRAVATLCGYSVRAAYTSNELRYAAERLANGERSAKLSAEYGCVRDGFRVSPF
jgi:hypothetical protein